MLFTYVLFASSVVNHYIDCTNQRKSIIWDEYAKDSITKDLQNINNDNYFTQNIKRTIPENNEINQGKIKKLEHELTHNNVLKAYIQNLLKSFIKERRRLMQDDVPPQPDIPIELGVVSKQQDEKEVPISPEGNDCNGELCNEIDNEKNLPTDVDSGVWHEEEFSSSSDSNKEAEDTHDVVIGEDDTLFPPKVPEIPIELGSAFQDNDATKAVVVECKKKKKPCQEPCTGNPDCPPDEAPPQPDIPIELGSARSELSDDQNNSLNGDEEVTFIPQGNLPKNFLLIENNPSIESDNTANINNLYSGSGEVESGDEVAQKRSLATTLSGDRSITTNNDGDFDGELLRDDNTQESVETPDQKSQYASVRSRRVRRSLSPVQTRIKRVSKKVSNATNIKHAKRSDIDEDKELLHTIESIDTEIATKRGLSRDDKPLQGYMRRLAHDVRSVMGEARNVLRNTGKVVHGLKRVINGATVLTSFTNNAVKFAKYFSMEPDNATIDYLEEKAIVAVLEAQKAANEARDAANLAKIASTKARAAERRMEVAHKQHKSLQQILPYIKTATRQAERAERASVYAAKNKQKTETDVMLMDKELKKMGSQLKKQNEQSPDSNESTKEESQPSKDNQDEFMGDSGTNTNANTKPENIRLDNKGKAKNYDEDYFYKKQKQLEEELKGKTKSSSSIQTLQNYAATNTRKVPPSASAVSLNEGERNKSNTTNEMSGATQNNVVQKVNEGPKLESYFKENVRTQETPRLSETPPQNSDSAELQYIASLNKRIASIKKEEEEAKERLKAAELARNFVASTTNKVLKVKEPVLASRPYENSNNIGRSNPPAPNQYYGKPLQPLLNDDVAKGMKASVVRTALPVKKSKQMKHVLHSKEKTVARKLQKLTTVETPEYNVPKIVKKEFSGNDKVSVTHADDSTGFRKQEIVGSKLKSSKKLKKQQLFMDDVLKTAKGSKDLDKIANALSAADNTLVSENYNPSEKKERVLYESKLLSERLRKMNTALRGLKFNIPNADKNVAGRRNGNNVKKSEFAQTIDKGRITVTVAVHQNHAKNTTSLNNDKTVDLIDPFGFKSMEETNEGQIADRNNIPKPSDYYKVEYQRSYIPRPRDSHFSQYDKKGVVVDDKK